MKYNYEIYFKENYRKEKQSGKNSRINFKNKFSTFIRKELQKTII